MQVDAETVDGACKVEPAPKKRRWRATAKPRLLMLEDLDRRTAIYRSVADEIAAIAADLGGSDRLSTAEHAIIQDAALAGAMAADLGARWLKGEEVVTAEYATLVNTRRRNLETVGIRRQPRPVAELGIRDIIAEHEAKTVEGAPR